MSIVRHVALAALVLPGAVFASNVFNVASSSCSGSLVSSSTDGLSFACTGDFALSNAAIFSDTFILLSATGSLQLTNVSLAAQTITLNAGNRLAIDAASTLQNQGAGLLVPPGPITLLAGGQIEIRQNPTKDVIEWNSVDIRTGGTVHLAYPGSGPQLGHVPEPESLALMLAGLATIGLACRKALKA
ncbi:MAG: PEP-CTERM sorting domain-containing protein [Rubrivivax sp.]|nr:MAG: PEP-CTERM sorting domain-containing protein [Rubrivivax sp.]